LLIYQKTYIKEKIIKNSKEKYGAISKIIHWTISGLFIYMFYLALTMTGMDDSQEKWGLYGEHKQFGILVGILVLFRISWKISNISPDYPQGSSEWKKKLATATHVLLYLIMITFPVSGYLMSMAGGHGIDFFGFAVPDIIGENKSLGGFAHIIHGLLEYITYIVVGLHIVGALYHHFVEKDNVLTRMLPFGK
jgi:cytochrome b561